MSEHIIINADRSVTVPQSLRKVGVQFDHNVNTITFDCPRYCSSVDLSTMIFYVNYLLPDRTKGSCKATNVVVDEADENLLHFDWTISRNVTGINGTLTCLVCAKKTNAEGIEENHWNSSLFKTLSIDEGMENGEIIEEEYPDLITQMLLGLESTDQTVTELGRKVGNSEDLDTENKTNLVAAVNEVKSYVTDLDTRSDATQNGLEQLQKHVTAIAGAYDITWTDGGYISRTDGTVQAEEGSSYSNFVPVESGTRLIIANTMTADTEHNAFYDAGETFVSSFSNATGTLIVPEGVTQMRLSKYTSATVMIASDLQSEIDAAEEKIDNAKAEIGELKSDIDNVDENNISKFFKLVNKNLNTSLPKYYQAIHDLKLTGFDTSKEHRLRVLCRNHSSYKYMIVVSEKLNGTWYDVLDSTTSFIVTENSNGLTSVHYSNGGSSIDLLVDYSAIPDGKMLMDSMLVDGRYVLTDYCYAQNRKEQIENSVNELKDTIFSKKYYSDIELGSVDYNYGVDVDSTNRSRTKALLNVSNLVVSVDNNIKFFVRTFNGTEYIKSYLDDFTDGIFLMKDIVPSGITDVRIVFSYQDDRDINNIDDIKEHLEIYSYANRIDQLESKINTKKLYALKTNDSCKIKFRYSDTENAMIEFARYGVNNFIHPRYFYKETKHEFDSNMDMPTWFTNGTDWVSPYRNVVSTDYPDNGLKLTVGGHHGTNNTVGYPTSRTVSIEMYADDEQMEDGEITTANKVTIISKAIMTASNRIDVNTGIYSDVFEEVTTWIVTQNNIEVSCYITAIENLSIEEYVGLQMITTMFDNPKLYFSEIATKYNVDGTMHNSRGLPYRGDRIVLFGDGDDIIVTYTNRNVGIGDLSHIGQGVVSFVSAFGKIYAHNVNNTSPLILNVGDNAYYSGGWTFAKTFDCDGAEKAYVIKENGESIYCVDFLSSGNSYVQLPTETKGKQIEVIYKSDSITCDSIVSGKGLKVKSSDVGTLKFKVNK